jgi:hypothetical protein
MKKDKLTNNDLQNTTQQIKYRATRIPLRPVVNSSSPEGSEVPGPHVTPVVLLLLNDTNPMISHECDTYIP